jgi:hypothetical protein
MVGYIIGENVRKISAERKPDTALPQRLEVKVNPEITNIVLRDTSIGGDKVKGLAIDFKFDVDYGSDFGKIIIDGIVFFTDTAENMKKIEADWKKDKKINDDGVRLGIMNRILEVGYMQAIPMASQVKLPAPLQMPRFVKPVAEKPATKK